MVIDSHIHNQVNSGNFVDKVNNIVAPEQKSELKINNLNNLLEIECCNNNSQCADILLAQVVAQSDSQINQMIEDLADMTLRSIMEFEAEL